MGEASLDERRGFECACVRASVAACTCVRSVALGKEEKREEEERAEEEQAEEKEEKRGAGEWILGKKEFGVGDGEQSGGRARVEVDSIFWREKEGRRTQEEERQEGRKGERKKERKQ